MRDFSQRVAANMASKGRGGDTRMAHVSEGEMVIPSRVLDENPGFVSQVVKAMQNSDLDWRRYVVGRPQNSTNPETGHPEFYVGGSNDRSVSDTPGGRGGAPDGGGNRDGGGRTGFEGSPEMGGSRAAYGSAERGGAYDGGSGALDGDMSYTEQFKQMPLGKYNPAGQMLGRMMDTGAMLGETLGGTFDALGGRQDVPTGGRDGPGGTSPTPAGMSQPSPPIDIPEPVELGFDPAMDDLQRRAAIATFGINSDDSLYRDPAVQDYYRSLIYDTVQSGGAGNLLPIELQYIEQILGIPVGSNPDELFSALFG